MNCFAMFRGLEKVRISAIAAILVASLTLAANGHAETYMTVSDVPVDVTAKNAAAARDQAIATAQGKAFDRLVKRLVPNAADQARIHPSQEMIEGFVQDFGVENERVSPVRYIGLYSVRFRASLVKKYLTDSGVNAVGDQQQVLVVPLYRTATGALLWDGGNDWRAAWDRGGFGDGPVTLILPNGDSFDTGSLSAAAAGNGDMGALGTLIGRYHAAGVIVATAAPRDPALGASSGLSLTLATYDQTGPKGAQTLTINPVPGEQAQKTLLRGVSASADLLETGWRQAIANGGSTGLVVSSGAPEQADVSAGQTASSAITTYRIGLPLVGVAEWVKVRNQLAATGGVQRISLDALTREGAAFTLDFSGDALALQAALSGSGYVLVQTTPANAAGPGSFQLRAVTSVSPGPSTAQ